MTKPYKWQRNNAGGFTLTRWREPTKYRYGNGKEWATAGAYNQCADVFRAKKGDRWVARWLIQAGNNVNWQQGSTLTLREAMRLAKFMSEVHRGD